MDLREIRETIQRSPLQPSETNPSAPGPRDILRSLFPDHYVVAVEEQGVRKGARRWLLIVDVDGERFGWLEDRVPGGRVYFSTWVWDVHLVEAGGFWAADDA